MQRTSRRCFAFSPKKQSEVGAKKRTQVLEREPPKNDWINEHSGNKQQSRKQSDYYEPTQSASVFPTYQSERRREEQTGSQWEHLGSGVVEHMRKVYGTLATGIGIAAGASMFAMATPLVGIHPLIPGLGAMVPLLGLMYTNKHTHSQTLRAGLFAAFTGLSGVSMAPLLKIAMGISATIVPQALLITCGLFGTMTALSLVAKPGAMLRLGVPLGGGLLVLMAAGIGAAFCPVTSAWYPLLHNVYMYGGLMLFTAYVAYDTQVMIDEFEQGEDDHIRHAVNLFINAKGIFMRVLSLLMMRGDD